ncbi:hypothetical protein DV738_g3771, partial [Chaetothyriales sp. CBS 135597]
MGKPPQRGVSGTLGNAITHPRSSGHSIASSTSSSIAEMIMDLEPPDLTSNSILSFLTTDAFDHNLQVPDIPFVPDFTLHLPDEILMEQPKINMISSQLRAAASSPPMNSNSSVETNLFMTEGALDPGSGSIGSKAATDLECLTKLHEILESLSVPQSRQSDNKAALPSAAGFENLTQPIPLDLILKLNRKATEGLGSLAPSSYARQPHVALLYASIISQILAWYRHAAGCSHNMTTPDTASARTGAAAATGSSTAADGGYSTPPASVPQSDDVTVAPSRMAIGTFTVDDQNLQIAMKIHLLSGEMKRVKLLINQLRAQTDNATANAHAVTTGADNVLNSINTWLEWDYARIFEMMQAKLKEVNI